MIFVKKIAENGFNFYTKYLGYDGIMDYMQQILYNISMPSNIMSIKKKKMRLAIITLYRDSSDNSRLKQKRLFIYLINKLFRPYCDFKLIIIEQQDH